jgi:hypothetical protein
VLSQQPAVHELCDDDRDTMRESTVVAPAPAAVMTAKVRGNEEIRGVSLKDCDLMRVAVPLNASPGKVSHLGRHLTAIHVSRTSSGSEHGEESGPSTNIQHHCVGDPLKGTANGRIVGFITLAVIDHSVVPLVHHQSLHILRSLSGQQEVWIQF